MISMKLQDDCKIQNFENNKKPTLERVIQNIQKMPEEISRSLTGKRKEIFKAVQNGEVKA